MDYARRGDPRGNAVEDAPPQGIKRFWLQSFLGIALVLLLAAVTLLYLWVTRDTAERRVQLNRTADALAENVTAEMARVRAAVDTWRNDPELRAVFRRDAGPAARTQWEASMSARVPGVLGVHLFAPEQITSAEGIPFMSYAGLDLARQAAQARTLTLVEVHKLGQPDMHLALAAPVLDESQEHAVGVVHVALPMTLLPDPLRLAGGRGVILYQQVVGDMAASLGNAAAPDTAPDYTVVIAGTRLRVAAWLGHAGRVDPWLVGEVSAVYLLTLALIGAVLALTYRAQRRALLQDCRVFTTLIDNAVNSLPLRRTKACIAEMEGAHQVSLELLRGLQPSRSTQRDAAAKRLRAGPDATPAPEPAPKPATNGSHPRPPPGEPEVDQIDVAGAVKPSPESVPQTTLQRAPGPLGTAAARRQPPGSPLSQIPAEVFRAYDIRGVVERQLTPESMRAIGQAIGSEAAARGDSSVMVGRDCRPSSAALCEALVGGLRSTGRDVVDLGVVPTPLVYFACCHPHPQAGAMVTASHNPAEYNGVKVVFHGESAQAEEIQALRERILVGDVVTGSGGYLVQDLIDGYSRYVAQDVTLARGLKVVLDCGNATASAVAPALFRALGCEVIELNCDLASGLPERMPDPSIPESTRDLGDLVVAKGADIGLAFDGDGDRLGVVDSQGRFVAADRVLMLLAADILSRHPGTDIIYDVKCSGHLSEEIRRAGGRPVMWRSGHAPLKAKLRESSALLAGELSGHFIFKERWFGFDDAIYAGARLLEVVSLDPRTTNEVFATLPGGLATPELAAPLAEGEPARIMQIVMRLADQLEGVEVIRVDGVRAEFSQGFGLVRASNTQPQLSFRFEGDDAEALEKIQALFRRLMEKAAPGLSLPF